MRDGTSSEQRSAATARRPQAAPPPEATAPPLQQAKAAPLPQAKAVSQATAAPRATVAPRRDEVDDLVEAWRRQRPDLDAEPLQVLSRISRLAKHLDLARRSAFASHRLEPWEFDVLSALRRQGPPFQMTPGALLRATLVTSGTMTNRVDRLAEAGLVRREPDPRDKRGVLVTLTSAGRTTVDAALADLLAREHELLAGLDGDERHTLADLLRTLLAPFDAEPPSPPAQ